MIELRQREPRVEDPAWLAEVRKMPCTICKRPGSDPAHIRAAAPQYGKRYTGKAEKPDDKWTLPLCRPHHDEQHSMNEIAFWSSYSIDPFALAIALYAARTSKPTQHRRKERRVKPRKPREQRHKVPQGRKLPSRPLRTPDERKAK